MSRLVSGLVVLALLALVGCDQQPAGRREPAASGSGSASAAGQNGAAQSAPASRASPRTNVVIFLIDTLRADRVGAYGYPKRTTPTLDALAAEGVLFENAHTPSPWTLPTVPSLMTSTFACEHGVISNGQRIAGGLETMAERFQKLGYHTASFYANNFAGALTGMHRGFDESTKVPHADARLITDWLNRRPKDRPFFLYLHNIEPHNPFNAPPGLIREFGDVPRETAARISRLIVQYRALMRAHVREKVPAGTLDLSDAIRRVDEELDALREPYLLLYDAVVRQADRRVAGVIETIKQAGLWDDLIFIVVSDHGEEFGDHGGYQHSQSVYQELAHVPWIMKLPGNQLAGTRIADVVTLVDVLPTVFDLLDRDDVIGAARGRSLVPLLQDASPRAPEFVVTSIRRNRDRYFKDWAQTRGDINIAVRLGSWKGIWNVQPDTFELYDLASDPGEQRDVAAEHPDLVNPMRAHVKEWYELCLQVAQRAEGEGLKGVDPRVLRELAAMGYVDAPDDAAASQPASAPARP